MEQDSVVSDVFRSLTLSGMIPPEIGALTSLVAFYAHNNALSGE